MPLTPEQSLHRAIKNVSLALGRSTERIPIEDHALIALAKVHAELAELNHYIADPHVRSMPMLAAGYIHAHLEIAAMWLKPFVKK